MPRHYITRHRPLAILFRQITMDEITPAGFQLHHVTRRNKKGGEVAVFVRNDIDSVLCQTDQQDTLEHITVKLSERQSSQASS